MVFDKRKKKESNKTIQQIDKYCLKQWSVKYQFPNKEEKHKLLNMTKNRGKGQ